MRIRREHTKTENHKKQRPATLKRLERGDDNGLERNLNWRRWSALVGRGDRGRKKSKTGECCSYQTAQFGRGDGQIKKIKTGEDVATAQLILALTKGVVNVGVVLSLYPF